MSHEATPSIKGNTAGAVDKTAAADMLAMIDGFRASRIAWAAAKLGIPDLLRNEAKSSKELAAATQTHAPSLDRALRALVSIGILTQDERERFGLTPLGATLRSGVPGSLLPWMLLMLGEENYRAWGDLLHSLRTGETAFDHVFGTSVWEYRERHPDQRTLFDAAMASLIRSHAAALVNAYSFEEAHRVVDVGGGDGTLLVAILRAHPRLEGVLFDLPEVVSLARKCIADAGVAERCAIVSGDAFASVPGDGDCYLLSRVIHDWDDERAGAILRNCRRALPQHGSLLLFERLAPAMPEASPAGRAAALTDLTMLIATGGRERTEAQYHTLLLESGLEPQRTIPTASGLSIICARAASPASRP